MKFLARLIPLSVFAPMFALAQGSAQVNVGYFTGIINSINTLIGQAIPVIFALAFLVFLWGMFTTFILGGADEEKQSKGKSLMLYAIIGFVVMISIWGIVKLAVGIFGFSTTETITPPAIPRGN